MDEAFGRYRLQELLGAGGMGQVFHAYDTELDRDVAIKVLPPQAGSDPTFEQRFRREARAAAGLGEPHVIPIYDSGEIDGRLFISMQLISGTDLHTVLGDRGPLPPERAVRIIEQAAAALDAAHGAELVHRDVKPANLLVAANDFVYLIDFGIARAPGETKLTSTGATIGTVSYMAPERFTTGHCDHRADIYALTCVLHECLTGTRPYPANSLEQQMFAHVNGPPPKPSEIQTDLPAALDDVIACGMAADPDERYQSAGDLAQAARAALGAAGASTHPSITHLKAGPDAATIPARNLTRATRTRWGLRRRWIAACAVAFVVVLVAAGGILYRVGAGHDGAPENSAAAGDADAPTPGVITIHVGRAPTNMAVDPETHSVYTANWDDNTVSVIDTISNAVTRTVDVGETPSAVAVDSSTHTAYATNWGDDTVSVIDTATSSITAAIPIAKKPQGLAVDPTTHTIYTTDWGSDTVSVVDTANNTVTTAIPVGSYPHAVAVDSGSHTVYTTNAGAKTVSVIDATTNIVTATVPIGRSSHGLAIDSTAHTVYATNSAENTVSVINAATNTLTTTVNVGRKPQGVAVDAAVHTAYVANADDDTVSLIDTTNNTVTGVLKVGSRPYGVAVDPTTHTAYVSNSAASTVSVIPRAR